MFLVIDHENASIDLHFINNEVRSKLYTENMYSL